MKKYYLYILANARNGLIYTGVTGNLHSRIQAHKDGLFDGYTKRHGITQLVYVEEYDRPRDAILREKQVKHWKREWRIKLIESLNPEWEDLFYKPDFRL
jgi:putative endonuclease